MGAAGNHQKGCKNDQNSVKSPKIACKSLQSASNWSTRVPWTPKPIYGRIRVTVGTAPWTTQNSVGNWSHFSTFWPFRNRIFGWFFKCNGGCMPQKCTKFGFQFYQTKLDALIQNKCRYFNCRKYLLGSEGCLDGSIFWSSVKNPVLAITLWVLFKFSWNLVCKKPL